MEIILSFLKILIPFFLISFISLFLIKILRISDFIEKVLLLFLFNWFQIILIIEILSLFKKVSFIPLIISYSLIAIICLIISITRKISYKVRFYRLKEIFTNFYNKLALNRVLKTIIIIWLLIIMLTSFFIGVTVPPKNYDSMTYHLTRATFWKQNHTIDHYLTRNIRQIENPMNAEIGFLWLMIFTNSDSILFLIQWASLLIIIIALYKTLRLIGFRRSISLVASFIFSTLNMVIFQASSTQNDLLIASFMLLTIYFILKVIKSDNLEFKFIILAGLTAGLTIGTKGYSFLFVPGVLLLVVIFGKITKIKWIKISYLILFSIIGCFLFASYNWVQNYINFGNILSSTGTVNMMKIVNPNFKTFVSNFLRHLTSFYQLKDYDHGTISLVIQKILNIVHHIFNLDISSPDTTWPGQQFYLSVLALNMDFAYFGPLCSLIIIPSVFYNLLLFVFWKKFRRNLNLKQKYKDSLKIIIITAIFFITYTFIFKWQPWAGRLMISFVLLMMFSFAMLIELLRNVNIKHFFSIIVSLLIFISIIFSAKVLFNSEDPKLVPLGGDSIYSVSYDERRYINTAPYMEAVEEMVNNNLDESSNLGLATSSDDWDYIYFGKNFKRDLFYISEEEYIKKNVKDILYDNNLDGLLMNKRGAPSIPEEEYLQKIENINYKEEGNYILFYR